MVLFNDLFDYCYEVQIARLRLPRHLHKQRIFVCRARGWHSATGQCVRRRILRTNVTGGGFGGASGTAPIIRHGRSGEVQAALYTGAQPVGGHYSEFPTKCLISAVHLIGRAD